MAWAYRPYLKDDRLVEIEDEARAGKRGLWADTQTPIPPWQWRADVRRPMK
jgi:micrococcal nuclease